MTWTVQTLWLIPALPLLAAGMTALAKRPQRTLAATLAIGSVGVSFLLSCWAFAETLGGTGVERQVYNFDWLKFGDVWLQLGWMLDPLTAGVVGLGTFVWVLLFFFKGGLMAPHQKFNPFFFFFLPFSPPLLGGGIPN